MATKAKQAKAPKMSVGDAVRAQWPFFDRLSSAAQRTLVARYRAANAPAAAAAPAPAVATPAAPPAAAPLTAPMPANVRVNDPGEDVASGNQTTQSEPSIAVHHKRVVVGYNDSSFAPNYTGYSNSTTGGHVFHDRGGLTGNQSGDNVLDVNRHGHFYYATLSTDAAGNSCVGVCKSTDGGVTFTPPVNASTTADGPAFFQDKEWLVVDRSGEDSSTDGNIYVVWTKFAIGEQILFARSTDGGNTWSAPLALSPVGNPQGAILAIAPEGDIFVCWVDRGTSQIFVTRSQDAGLTFANLVPANGPVQNIIQIPGTMNGNIRANSFPSIAIDQDDGQIYITYSSQVGPDHADVFLTVSKDHGKTWSPPVRVNDDATQTDQWMPSVAVTDEGTVGVMFYDRRNDAANLSMDVYLALSTNHGKSFHPNQRITTTSFPPAINFDPAIAFNYMGDYNQMVAQDERFYMVWGDNRDTVGARHDPNVYFAVFDVDD